VDVAGPRAGRAGMTFSRDPNLLAVVDSRGDLDIERALLEPAPLAIAARARLFDPLSGAPAGRTRLRADELTEGATRDPLRPSRASAGLADDRARSRCGAGAGACGADDPAPEPNVPRHSAPPLPHPRHSLHP